MSVSRDKSVTPLTVVEALPSPVDSILDLVVFLTDLKKEEGIVKNITNAVSWRRKRMCMGE